MQFLDTSAKTCIASCVTRGSRFLDLSLSFCWGRVMGLSFGEGIQMLRRQAPRLLDHWPPRFPQSWRFLFIASRTGACNFDKSRARHDRHEQYISSPNYARGRPSLPSGKWYPLPSTCERAPSRSCGIATGRRPRLVAQGRGFPATALTRGSGGGLLRAARSAPRSLSKPSSLAVLRNRRITRKMSSISAIPSQPFPDRILEQKIPQMLLTVDRLIVRAVEVSPRLGIGLEFGKDLAIAVDHLPFSIRLIYRHCIAFPFCRARGGARRGLSRRGLWCLCSSVRWHSHDRAILPRSATHRPAGLCLVLFTRSLSGALRRSSVADGVPVAGLEPSQSICI